MDRAGHCGAWSKPLTIATVGDLIRYAMRISGIAGQGQTPSSEDMQDAIDTLIMTIGQWQQRRWLTFDLAETVVTSTGATTYTIGTGGAFNVPRPDRIESAFMRFLSSAQQIDYPLGIIPSREDYNNIALKSFVSWPGALFYESSYPLGILHFYPVPSASVYELHVFTKSLLPVYVGETDALALPDEYIEALTYTMVVKLTLNYGLDPKPGHVAAMKAALNTIRQSNTQIAALQMPAGLPGMRRGSGVGNLMVGQGFGRAFILDNGPVLS